MTARIRRCGGAIQQIEGRRKGADDLIDAVLDAAAQRHITQGSALRLIFLMRRAGEKGYAWWKRTRLAEHWGVHPSTITRDYERWTELRFVKLRPNPFKASAKLVTFSWSKVWDDLVWSDPEKVASMLPDLREAFRQEGCERRMRATRKGRTDATCLTACTITENLNSKNVKQQQAAAGEHACGNFSAQIPRKPPSDACSEGASPLGSSPDSADIREEVAEGFSSMQAILAEYHVRVQPGDIRKLIGSGQRQGLTIDGVFAFTEYKLKQKRDTGDPVISVKLLIKAINDESDRHHWAAKAHRCSSYFEHARIFSQAHFSVEELRDHLSSAAKLLRASAGYEEIAAQLDLLISDAESQHHDLEALDQRLIALEEGMIAIARSRQTEDDVVRIRQKLNSLINPYRGKMTAEQLDLLTRQYLDRSLFEALSLPRLALFYLRPSRTAA